MSKINYNSFGPNPADYPAVRFQHFHDSLTGRLCLTLASVETDSGSIRFAGAVVSSKDLPNKDIGRRIALGRLLSIRGRSIELDAEYFRSLVASRKIIDLFEHPDNYKLKPQRIVQVLKGNA